MDNLPAIQETYQIAERLFKEVEGLDEVGAVELIPKLDAYGEIPAAFLGYICWLVDSTRYWEKLGYGTFTRFCEERIKSRSLSTIVDLKNNYAFYCQKRAYLLKDLVYLTARVGWSVLRELRIRNLSAEEIEAVLPAIEERRLNRQQVKEELKGKAKEVVELEKWRTFKVRLPEKDFRRLRKTLEHIKGQEKDRKRDDSWALMMLAEKYWV